VGSRDGRVFSLVLETGKHRLRFALPPLANPDVTEPKANEADQYLAVSPDGRRLAAGGWDASYAKLGSLSLSLVDLDSGSVRRVGAFEV